MSQGYMRGAGFRIWGVGFGVFGVRGLYLAVAQGFLNGGVH